MEAQNSLGYGTPSSLNTGASDILAQIAPHKPPATPSRDSATSQSSLVVDYAIPVSPYTGGSTILSLNL